MKSLLLDNGAGCIKAGWSLINDNKNSKKDEYKKISNCIVRSIDKKIYIGEEIDTDCLDTSSLIIRRPFERGQLVNWESEHVIWNSIFYNLNKNKKKKGLLNYDDNNHNDVRLVLSEMPFTLRGLSFQTNQVVFEEYQFGELIKKPSAGYSIWNNTEILFDLEKHSSLSYNINLEDESINLSNEATLVIDSGFSATHIIPIVRGEIIWQSIRRIDIGGKLLTNYLKELISLRYYSVMDEPYLINQIKEQACFISLNFINDLDLVRKRDPRKIIEYVLPNFSTTYKGHVRKPNEILSETEAEQVLTLSNERFSVPELLFNPSDIGLQQAGIPETIMQSIDSINLSTEDDETNNAIKSLLLSNIILTGGNSLFENYSERIKQELTSLASDYMNIRIGLPNDPIGYSWNGASNFANLLDSISTSNEFYQKNIVTRNEYLEYGSNICLKKFAPALYE